MGRIEVRRFIYIFSGSSYALGMVYDFQMLCKQRELLTLVGTPIKKGQQIKEHLSAQGCYERDVHIKGNNLEAKGNALADYYCRQSAPIESLTLIIHQEANSPEIK